MRVHIARQSIRRAALVATVVWYPFSGGVAAADAPVPSDGSLRFALVEHRISAPEARQGVASDGEAIYVIDNSLIGKYAIADGSLIRRFEGDPEQFPHLNSCTLVERELVCAASNYPETPHRGTVEVFDPDRLTHVRTVVLPENPGSLTVLTRRAGTWWAVFANYDGRGGVEGQDHRSTLLAELDDDFRLIRRFSLPESVLERLKPRSISGATWGEDGRLYMSGHDKPEVYALELPQEGAVLRHVGSFAVASFGQAIDLDPKDPQLLWSIDRNTRAVFGSRLPPAEMAR
mgnify:CR=1 FL=1